MFNCAATPPSGVSRGYRLEQTGRVSTASERQINIVRCPRAAVRFTLSSHYAATSTLRAICCPRPSIRIVGQSPGSHCPCTAAVCWCAMGSLFPSKMYGLGGSRS